MSEFAKTHETIEMLRKNTEDTSRPEFDFDARISALKEQKEKIAQTDCLDDGEITRIVGEIGESGESFLIMKDTLERISRETNYLHDWIESGVLIDMINADLSNPKANKMSEQPWGKSKMKGSGLFIHKPLGIGSGKILVRDKEPEYVNILNSLALEGEFPKPLRVYGHEVIHSYQSRLQGKPFSPKDLVKYIRKRILPEIIKDFPAEDNRWQEPVELKEIQANRQSNNPPERKTSDELFKRFETTSHKTEEIRLKKAIDLIDKFNALGYSVEELGELVQDHGGWDKSTKTYPRLESILKKEMDELDIGGVELEKLVEIDRLERGIEQEKVKRIVQDELKKFDLKNNIKQID